MWWVGGTHGPTCVAAPPRSKTLTYYRGDYDTFETTRAERMRHRAREIESAETKKAHMQAFIDRFRYNANRAALVQSRLKAMERMHTLEEIIEDPKWRFQFPEPEPLGRPVLQVVDVGFGYDATKPLFKHVDFGVDTDRCVCVCVCVCVCGCVCGCACRSV